MSVPSEIVASSSELRPGTVATGLPLPPRENEAISPTAVASDRVALARNDDDGASTPASSEPDTLILEPGTRFLRIGCSVPGAARLAVALWALYTAWWAVMTHRNPWWDSIVLAITIFVVFFWDLVSGLLCLRLRVRRVKVGDPDNEAVEDDLVGGPEGRHRGGCEERPGDRTARRVAMVLADGFLAFMLFLLLLSVGNAMPWRGRYPFGSVSPGAMVLTSFLIQFQFLLVLSHFFPCLETREINIHCRFSIRNLDRDRASIRLP